MESALLVFQQSVKDQGCLIDECLLLRLGMKIRKIEYTKFTLEDGRVTKCTGSASATSQIVENARASKSITFRAKIIRDLGCDAIGDKKFFKKFHDLKLMKSQDNDSNTKISFKNNPVGNQNGKGKRKDKRETTLPPESGFIDDTGAKDNYEDKYVDYDSEPYDQDKDKHI